MEMTPSIPQQPPPLDAHQMPLGRVMVLALLCGTLTFGCLFSTVRNKATSAPASTLRTPIGEPAPTLADNNTP